MKSIFPAFSMTSRGDKLALQQCIWQSPVLMSPDNWHKECQVMCGPPTLRDTFQVSHLWHVTLLSWPIGGQDLCHVTRSQPIRGECDLVSGWPGASALSGESSIWSLISVDNDIVCQSGIRGLGELPMGDQRFAAKTWFIHSHFKISSTKNMKYFLSPASTLFFTPKYLPVVLSSVYSLPVCILINVGYDLF